MATPSQGRAGRHAFCRDRLRAAFEPKFHPMKIFFDFLPVILFFGTFKYAEGNADAAARFATEHLGFLVSGGVVGTEEAPVLLATLIVILATLVQVAVQLVR